MKNKIQDLRNHLFAQIEKISDPECDLDKEVQRSASLVQLAEAVIETAEVEIQFIKAIGREHINDFLENQSVITIDKIR